MINITLDSIATVKRIVNWFLKNAWIRNDGKRMGKSENVIGFYDLVRLIYSKLNEY